MSQHNEMGNHIRRLRISQQLTLQKLADKCGFTKSLLSKIETGNVIPSVSTLVKIAGALGTNVAALMTEGDNLDCVFIPAVENIKSALTESGHVVLPLAVEMKEKKMQPCIFSVSAEDINDMPKSHVGEEFIFILDGSMDFQVGEICYTLGPKDSIFFNCIRDHAITKVHSDKVVYLNIFN